MDTLKGQNRSYGIVLVIVGLFIVLNVALVWTGGTNHVFNSPDENANYHFSYNIYSSGKISFPLSNTIPHVTDYLAPRSARVIGDEVVPASFIGLVIIYGVISKLIFFNLIPYLTILISGVALFCFYLILRDNYTTRTAVFGTALLAVHPAWIYYTHATLFPNVLFVSLCIFSFFFFQQGIRNHRTYEFVLFGFFLSLAFFVRLSEVVWIAPVMVYGFFVWKKRLTKRDFINAVIPVLVVSAIALLIHRAVYTGGGLIGYNVGGAGSVIDRIKELILPFGFHPRLIFRNIFNYGILIFWPFTALGLSGLLAAWFSRTDRIGRSLILYVPFILILASVLSLYYGSWIVTDYPDPNKVTISISFVRYFLPIYVVLIPLGAFLIERLRNIRFSNTLIAVIIVCLSLNTYYFAFAGNDDGIFMKNRVVIGYDMVATWISKNTENNALFVTNIGDKYIWPSRTVMAVPEDNGSLEAFTSLIQSGFDPYYVGVSSDMHGFDQFDSKLAQVHLRLSENVFTIDDISIYMINEQE